MAKAFDLGFKVRDCTLCGRYKIPTSQSDRIDGRLCRFCNKIYTYMDNNGRKQQIPNPYICWLPYRCNGFDKSQEAAGCHAFYIDKKRISNIVRSFESKTKLMWIDDEAIEKDKIEQDAPVLVSIESCRHICQYNRWDCGHCLGSKKKEEHNYIICNRKESKLLM